MSKDRVQVIDRAVDLLGALADGPRTLSEICRATGLSKATAFRLLGGLIARDMVAKDPVGSTYMLGPALLRLVQGAQSGIGVIATMGNAALSELSDQTGETVALHVQSGIERLNVKEVPSHHSVRYSSVAGAVAPIHNGSVGVVLLAFSLPAQQARTLDLLQESGQRLDRPALEKRLARARRDGWAVSVGERVPGATAISIPVQAHQLLLALSVLGPAARLPQVRLKSFLPLMREAAERLLVALGEQSPLSLEQAS